MSPFTKLKTEPTIVTLPSGMARLILSSATSTPSADADTFNFSGLVRSLGMDAMLTLIGLVRTFDLGKFAGLVKH